MPSVDYVLQKALYHTLSTAGIVLNGTPVPVYAHVPADSPSPYIVLDQISTVSENGSVACHHWESVFQLTILTSFPVAGQVSDLPVLDIQGQVIDALEGQHLTISDDYQMHPITIAQTRKSTRFNQNSVEVMGYIVVKMKVYKDKNNIL